MSYIVCGFYTPDYREWLYPLTSSLDQHGCSHDFVETQAVPGGWEVNTMRKAFEVEHAMSRHPDKTIIWLDVDCVVHGSLNDLAALPADVSVFMNARVRRNGGYKLHAITRTIVFQPTRGARDFVGHWIDQSARARYGDVDQTAFLLALAASRGTSFMPLERKWSAVRGEPGVISHDQASAEASKIGRAGRLFNSWWNHIALDPR